MNAIDFKHTLEVLDKFGNKLITEYRKELEADNISNGELYKTIDYTVSSKGGEWVVSVSLADYWKYLEYGRKPGKFPPISAIENWIKVKRILPHSITLKSGKTVLPTIPQLSFLIARKIARDGTKPRNYFKTAFEEVKAEFLEKIKSAIEQDIKESLELS